MTIINAQAVTDLLRQSGSIGLHFDEMKQALGNCTNICLRGHLNTLTQNSIIEKTQNGGYRVTEKGLTENPLEEKVANVAYPTQDQYPKQYTATSRGNTNLPCIYLPGASKFNSYKNSLQEYCQKLRLKPPAYVSIKNEESKKYTATCTFDTLGQVSTPHGCQSSKEAEQLAAFMSLKQLGYLPDDVTFQHTSATKRKMSDSGENKTCSKSIKIDAPNKTSKSKLNEIAQTNQLAIPTYHTVLSTNGFFSTVKFNGREFKGQTCHPKKKDAEQDAAFTAYNILSTGGDVAVEALQPGFNAKYFSKFNQAIDNVNEMVSEARGSTTTNNKGVQSYKNRLQEYCQSMKTTLPEYSTQANEDKTAKSTVKVNENVYEGEISKSKKEAEQQAALVALRALGLSV